MILSTKAKQIYDFCNEEGCDVDLILGMENIDKVEYDNALWLVDFGKGEHTFDAEHDNELYREYQQANYDEYFDWAHTYRYRLFK